MLAFCAPGPSGIHQRFPCNTKCIQQPLQLFHQFSTRTLPTTRYSRRTTSSSQPTKVLMSVKGLSYAAAAIILCTATNRILPDLTNLLQPTQASETHHIASAPQRFSQSFTLEEATPMKLDPHWDVHSIDSKTETFVMFTNDSSHVVDIWWVDYYGREVYYASVRPGTSHMQPSYATHPWVVRDHISQNPLLVLVAKDSPALAVVHNTII